jgi:hypothetical protein
MAVQMNTPDVVQAPAGPSAAEIGGIVGGVAGTALSMFTGVPGLGHAFSKVLGGSEITPDMSPEQLLDLQRETMRESFVYSTASAVSAAEHEARMSVVRNLRN